MITAKDPIVSDKSKRHLKDWRLLLMLKKSEIDPSFHWGQTLRHDTKLPHLRSCGHYVLTSASRIVNGDVYKRCDSCRPNPTQKWLARLEEFRELLPEGWEAPERVDKHSLIPVKCAVCGEHRDRPIYRVWASSRGVIKATECDDCTRKADWNERIKQLPIDSSWEAPERLTAKTRAPWVNTQGEIKVSTLQNIWQYKRMGWA